ncbi:hypothetical protein [Anaerovibrio lipolyticus]|uniref:hypothetical protein n=1 Tax=Anaerovibrio lipolyticus TaxID=82374 RepID=UPI0013566F3B|nr:hypothetical protein [Anaerovibrio lipolyticus]
MKRNTITMPRCHFAMIRHAALNWVLFVKIIKIWVITPIVVILVMLLCGWCDGQGR